MYKNGGLIARADFIGKLERKFTSITKSLYTTSVPYDVLERDVMPYIADDFIFKNPWQEGGDKNMYTIGMKGFHTNSSSVFEMFQIGIKLSDDGKSGRCFVDGEMTWQQLFWNSDYRLRTIFDYDFRLIESDNEDADEPIQFEIFRHEEMWSYADMIDGIPGVGRLYTTLFRPAYCHLFAVYSRISCLVRDFLAELTKQEKVIGVAVFFFCLILPFIYYLTR